MNKQLNDKQIKTLERMGVVWNFQGTKVEKELDENFMDQLVSLTTYKREKGHYDVPAGNNLYEWIEHMRNLKKNNLLPAKHEMMLNAISFPWVPFQDGFELYTQYLTQNKSQDIPPEHPCYKWCEKNREQYRNGKLEKGLENILRACGFIFECAGIRKTNGSMPRGAISARSSEGNKENMRSNQSRVLCGSNHGRGEGNKGLHKERNNSVIDDDAAEDSSSDSISSPPPKRASASSFQKSKRGKMSQSYEDSSSESDNDSDTSTPPPPRRKASTRKALKKQPLSSYHTSSQDESSDSDTTFRTEGNSNRDGGIDNLDSAEAPNENADKNEIEGGTAQDEAALSQEVTRPTDPINITPNKRSNKDANEDRAVQVEGTSSQDGLTLTAAACSNENGDKDSNTNLSEDGFPQGEAAVNPSISIGTQQTEVRNLSEINKKIIMSLSKADLKEACGTRCLKTSGLKPDLQKRLLETLK